MRKLLLAIAIMIGVGMVIGSPITFSTAQPIEGCTKKNC
jgi:hypothetical protein